LSRDLAEALRAAAIAVGFDRAGIAAIDRTPTGEAFVRWLEADRHAGMAWMERRTEERLDPRALVPWARTALCVALQYADASDDRRGDLWRGVARYARGEDYHRLMERRLDELCRRVEAIRPGTRTRRYVDTGPVLERDLAARAGLGAVGKNTNLLHPEAGSYFFLGEIFLDCEAAPDVPIEDLCGTCTACLDACPTGAFPEPWVLDSRRCISYWTIEHRGALPEEVREDLSGWVFGCDICQEVCPWNRAPVGDVSPALESSPRRSELDLIGVLRLSREAYVERFRGSAMKRAKLEGLKRNAVAAMATSGRSAYVPALLEAISGGDPELGAQAAWALGRIGGPEAREGLESALESASEGGLKAALRRALRRASESDLG